MGIRENFFGVVQVVVMAWRLSIEFLGMGEFLVWEALIPQILVIKI